MTKRKTTPEERREFIEQQRAREESHKGPGRYLPADMSFIDKEGNIVRPNREEYLARQKRKHYETIALVGFFSGLFLLSSSATGNSIVNVSQSSVSWLGIILLFVGLIGGFFWINKH